MKRSDIPQSRFPSAVGTIAILLLVLFGIEIMLMYLLPLVLPVDNPLLENLADSGLLTLLFTPVLYRFIFRPFREIAEVQKSLAETIMAQLVDGVVVLDGKLAIRSLNGAAERIFGYAGSEAAGKGIGEMLGKALEGLGEPARAPLPPWPGEPVREVEAIRRDGSRLAVELSVSPLRLGGEWLWLAMVRDVSARKQDHLRLKETLSLLGATIEATADGILVKDLKGTLVICNRRFAEMWRLPPHLLETGNDQLMRAFVAEQLKEPGEFLELTEKEYLGTERESRDWLSFKDGRIFERYSSPQVVDDRIVGRVICFKDLTEQRHLEHQLRHAQKMEALGALAGGVAHDFNNILTVVMGFCTITAAALEEQSPLRRNLEQIMTASERALTLTASLLTYSRKQPMNLKPLELNGRVRQTERFLARLIGAEIELVTTLCQEQLTVLADGGQLEQVLMNLATNARDAMAGKGCLAIDTRRIEIEEEFVRLHGYGAPGSFVLITVSDTGAGMEQSVREKIFEPFFTTKETGHGTGLGLSIVYGIVKQHQGYINVYSEPGKGTSFRIYLPLIDAVEVKSALSLRQVSGGSETLLLAEDDPGVRALVRSVLVGAGYRVIEACDGEEAAASFREHLQEVDLLVLDVVMPKKNGRESFEEISAMRPGIKALFISGYPPDIVSRNGLIDSGFHLLMKPLLPNQLLAKVREMLDKEKTVPQEKSVLR